MNFRPTKGKVLVSILILLLDVLFFHYVSSDNDSNLVITLAPSMLVYLTWSLFGKKRK